MEKNLQAPPQSKPLYQIVPSLLKAGHAACQTIDELLRSFKPHEYEGRDNISGLQFDFPDGAAALHDLQLSMPRRGADEAVWKIHDKSCEFAERIICARILLMDIIEGFVTPHENNSLIHMGLASIENLMYSICHFASELEREHDTALRETPEYKNAELAGETDEDEEDDEEEVIKPNEIENFHNLKASLLSSFQQYIIEHPSEYVSLFFKVLQEYLEKFGNGEQPDQCLDFSYEYRAGPDNGCRYISFHFEQEIMEVCSGGSEYDPDVGSDSYTSWTYTLGLNGWEDDTDFQDFSDLMELIGSGAKLDISNPEEFAYNDEEEVIE